MLGSLLALTVGLLLTAPPDTLPTPRDVVRETIRAVEGDSVGHLPWKSRLERDSTDRIGLLGSATLARLQYDYPTAERLYRRLLQAQSGAPDRFGVYARLGLAQGLDAQGFGTKAEQELTRARTAAHTAGESVAEGEALLGLSLQRAFSQGVETGLATLDTVERLVPAGNYDLHAERLRQRGALRGIVGKPGARADAEQALILARRAGTHRLVGQALRATAQLLQFEGKADSSIMVLRQAEDSYRQAHDRSQLSSALLWHVNALLARGAFGEASELAHLALTEGEAAHALFGVGTAYTALGAITISLGDFAKASEYLSKSISLFERLEDSSSVMKARDYLAVTALAAGNLPEARRQTLEVLEWYRRTQDPTIEFSAHRNLAIIAMHERNWPAAERALEDARALAQRMKRPLWMNDLAYDNGRLALFRGDLGAAERNLRRYLATLDSSQHVFRHDARVRLADVYATRGDLARAEREARLAWDELERWRATLTDRELRVLAFQASPTEMSDRDASVVRVLAALAQHGRVAESFGLAERRRARELEERLEQARALTPDATKPGPEAHEQSIPVITVEAVQKAIPDDSTALLEYVTGSLATPTTLFIVTRSHGLESRILPAADSLTPTILRFEALVQSGNEARELSKTLGDALLSPALARLPSSIHRLIIVPDGPLHRLPFDALQLSDGRYAMERYTISLSPSAAVLASLRLKQNGKSEENTPVRLLAMGDPAFTDPHLEPLRESGKEARRVARYAPESVVKVREAASAAYLKHAQLTPFRVIHFATHTLVDEHSAARTALALAPGEGETGLVGPSDLAALRLNADLVVLSSCRSAGGVLVNGEGIQGLTAPLLEAGTRSVVATHWQVNDRSTYRFIDAFYTGLAHGLTMSEALRSAKLSALKRKAPPAEWAAFTAIGDPTVKIPLRSPPGYSRWIAGLAGLGLIALALGYSRLTWRGRTSEAS
jgi:CHAT domain-containing protein/tetratricopeptide (TPR) repeat protein